MLLLMTAVFSLELLVMSLETADLHLACPGRTTKLNISKRFPSYAPEREIWALGQRNPSEPKLPHLKQQRDIFKDPTMFNKELIRFDEGCVCWSIYYSFLKPYFNILNNWKFPWELWPKQKNTIKLKIHWIQFSLEPWWTRSRLLALVSLYLTCI